MAPYLTQSSTDCGTITPPDSSRLDSRKMAEQAGEPAPPTFKLVLVGDGGTGKVDTDFPKARYLNSRLTVCGRLPLSSVI